MLPPETLSFPTSLRLLENCYDGLIPAEHMAHAAQPDPALFVCQLAQAAERRFQHRLYSNLQMMTGWRQRNHPQRWQRLRVCSEAVTLYRHRAREAFDLSA